MKDKFGGVNVMRSVLILEETPPSKDQSFNDATELNLELSTDIEMETVPQTFIFRLRYSSQNTGNITK